VFQSGFCLYWAAPQNQTSSPHTSLSASSTRSWCASSWMMTAQRTSSQHTIRVSAGSPTSRGGPAFDARRSSSSRCGEGGSLGDGGRHHLAVGSHQLPEGWPSQTKQPRTRMGQGLFCMAERAGVWVMADAITLQLAHTNCPSGGPDMNTASDPGRPKAVFIGGEGGIRTRG
jgi:hypothetical protein